MHYFELIQKPGYQVLLFVCTTILLTLITRPRSSDKIWVVAGLLYFLFILTNAIFVFNESEVWSYFFISLGFSFLYLLVIAVTVKVLIKVLKRKGEEESAMIFLIVIFHPILLLVSIFLGWIF